MSDAEKQRPFGVAQEGLRECLQRAEDLARSMEKHSGNWEEMGFARKMREILQFLRSAQDIDMFEYLVPPGPKREITLRDVERYLIDLQKEMKGNTIILNVPELLRWRDADTGVEACRPAKHIKISFCGFYQ